MPQGSARFDGTGVYLLKTSGGSSRWTSTGTGPWVNLGRCRSRFSVQIINHNAGTSNWNIKIQGSLTTGTTGTPVTLLTHTQAANGATISSTALHPVQYIRFRSTALGGTTAKSVSVRVGVSAA